MEGKITSNDGEYKVLFENEKRDDEREKQNKPTAVSFCSQNIVGFLPAALLPLQVSDDFSNFFNEARLVLSCRLSLTHSFARPQHIRR